jgi:non-specific serine/threonine protein kinase/serine/threonine-protein kinase
LADEFVRGGPPRRANLPPLHTNLDVTNALEPADWERARALFAAAQAWPPELRRQRLLEACADRPTVRAEVESLLGFQDRASGFLEQPALAAAPDLSAPTVRAGARLGPYRVLEELAEGGMGAVFLAVRDDDEFHKRVAIKLIRAGLESPELVARFRAERQILAGLDHPGIARLLDGGTTADGRPYLVMDHVDGVPITEHCRRAAPGVPALLRLFLEVCDAVEHAHRNLVVHRDLKPANVLVEAAGRPRLLDFGIAKLLAPEAAEVAATGTGLRPMTLAYASPEQVRGQPVTTGADVYSLGVVLYELLAGRHPHGDDLSSLPAHEVARRICDDDPKPPSALAPRDRALLRGDLDTIVLSALARDPARRYASVERLSEDLRRHLAGLPVLARGDSLGYRAGRFVRRHAPAVGAAGFVLLAVVAGALATASQAREARRAQAQAERRYADVRRLTHRLLFEYHDAIEALPGATPVRQRMVQDALAHLDALAREQKGDDPVLLRELAAAYERIGKVQGNSFYSNLGDTTGALRSYRKALAIRERLLAAGAADAFELRREVAAAVEGIGDVQWTTNDLLGARVSYRRAAALLEDLARDRPADRSIRLGLATLEASLGDLAGNPSYANLGDTADALRHHQRALAVREGLHGEAPADEALRDSLAESEYHVAGMLRATGDFPGAIERYRRALAIKQELAVARPENGERARLVAATRNALAQALEDAGRFAEAAVERRRALETGQRLLRADPLDTKRRRAVAVFERGLAALALHEGRTSEARARALRALATSEELARLDAANADARRELFASHRLAGLVFARLGQWQEARQEFARATPLAERLLAPLAANAQARDDMAAALEGLGTALHRTGETARALESLRRSRALRLERFEADRASVLVRYDLVAARLALAEALAGAAPEEACRERRAALALWQELRDAGRLRAADAGRGDRVRAALAACPGSGAQAPQ